MASGINTKFLQTVHLVCDDQGRITLPVHIRNVLSALGTMSLLVGIEDPEKPDFLTGYNELAFSEIMDMLDELNLKQALMDLTPEEESRQRRNRHKYGGFALCTPDKQNRINIPQHLREAVGIRPGTKVAMVGMGNRLEIWEAGRLEADRAKMIK